MGLEKLTYSGSEYNNYVYFVFDGEYYDVNAITRELKIEPTSVKLKKDPVPKNTSWFYKIGAGKEEDLRDEIDHIVKLFMPKIDLINKLKDEFDLQTRFQFVLYVDIHPEASTPCFKLSQQTIEFLGKTKSEVDFDLYIADTVNLLNRMTLE